MTTRPELREGASARLVAGESDVNLGLWRGPHFYWVSVGSSPEADWRVDAEGVAPAHCELLWDGAGLYVRDRLRLGCTYIENRRVEGWSPLQGSHLLRLGAAALWTRAVGQTDGTPDGAALRWVEDEIERRRDAGTVSRRGHPSWATAATKILSACFGMGATSLDPWM